MDYSRMIDAETWEFIRRVAESNPDDAASLDIEGRRRVYDAVCRTFYRGRPEGIKTEDRDANGVPVRVYWAGHPTRTVVYAHGGGFILGGLDSHDDVCAEICAQTGYRVVAVDYRLCPEHRHPVQFHDCRTAVDWADAEFRDPIVLAGDSAGGNLVAAVAHEARGRLKSIWGQVLIYPVLAATDDAPSYVENALAPMLTAADVAFYQDIRFDGPRPAGDPTWAPLSDSDFEDLPPTVVITADCDPLRDDGRMYCEAITAAGGRAAWINEEGLIHGYLRARGSVTRAQDSFERITVAIEALGQGLWPYD